MKTETKTQWEIYDHAKPVKHETKKYYIDIDTGHLGIRLLQHSPTAEGITKDAKRIVKAVNNHSALVEALEDALALIVNGPDNCDDDPARIVYSIREAIAQAKEQS